MKDVFWKVKRLSLLISKRLYVAYPHWKMQLLPASPLLMKKQTYTVSGYQAVDRINNLVLLKVEGIERQPIPLYAGIAPESAKSIYLTKPQNNTLPLHRGKVLEFATLSGAKLYRVDNQFRSKNYGNSLSSSLISSASDLALPK